MNLLIKVSVKQVYGNTLIYPACQKAKELVLLTGKKTFSESDIAIINRLGYHVSVVIPPESFCLNERQSPNDIT